MNHLMCAFTGPRPQNLPYGWNENDPRCVQLKDSLYRTIEYMVTHRAITMFLSGMACGVDMFAAEAVLKLKKKYPQILLECVFPHEQQAENWSEALRDRYYSIAEQADFETMICHKYQLDCFEKRNQYMVSKAQMLLAVWDGKRTGGTYQTLRLATQLKRGVSVMNTSGVFLRPEERNW